MFGSCCRRRAVVLQISDMLNGGRYEFYSQTCIVWNKMDTSFTIRPTLCGTRWIRVLQSDLHCVEQDGYEFYSQTYIVWNKMDTSFTVRPTLCGTRWIRVLQSDPHCVEQENNEVWQEQGELGHMPLVPGGDSFNITGHLHNDSLILTLNEAHVYSIPLGRLQDGIDGVDVSQSTILYINDEVELTSINLISAG